MCDGTVETSGVCLYPERTYQLNVRGIQGAAEIAWEFCNHKGGAPFTMQFAITSSGGCRVICPNPEIDIDLYPGSGRVWKDRGWGGYFYTIFHTDSGV